MVFLVEDQVWNVIGAKEWKNMCQESTLSSGTLIKTFGDSFQNIWICFVGWLEKIPKSRVIPGTPNNGTPLW